MKKIDKLSELFDTGSSHNEGGNRVHVQRKISGYSPGYPVDIIHLMTRCLYGDKNMDELTIKVLSSEHDRRTEPLMLYANKFTYLSCETKL